jgi:hypothetical protein
MQEAFNPIPAPFFSLHCLFAAMGISNLTRLLSDNAPGCIRENQIKNYFNRKVAIDASMSIYQFLVAVRSNGAMLANEAGETTRYRTRSSPLQKKNKKKEGTSFVWERDREAGICRSCGSGFLV